MSNTEFVMVPRELAEVAGRALSSNGYDLQARDLEAALSLQLQGAPVAWLVYRGMECVGVYRKDPIYWAHGYRLVPLYTHADPGEVERLRDALGHIAKTCEQSRTQTRRLRWISVRANLALEGRSYDAAALDLPRDAGNSAMKAKIETRHYKFDNERLRTQLAERDALLRDLVSMDIPRTATAIELAKQILSASAEPSAPASFQQRVHPWLMECFGQMIAGDREERNHRFLEEALELVQSLGATAVEAHQLVDYVYGRPVGDAPQEVGGVMVTLAALCLANDLDMHNLAEAELARVWTKVEQIRAKQANKPQFGPLPGVYPNREPSAPAFKKCSILKDCNVRYSDSSQGYVDPSRFDQGGLPSTSAPVERDERVDFITWAESRNLRTRLDGLVTTFADQLTDEVWQGWQARAALERKP